MGGGGGGQKPDFSNGWKYGERGPLIPFQISYRVLQVQFTSIQDLYIYNSRSALLNG